ncbi:MAG: stage II sporulation protein M [Chitinophagales bacterium]
MKETFFIQQNKQKWEEFETEFAKEKKDPEKLSSLFVQITDDLSYSRTYYPNRSVKIFLNNLAQKVFTSIYRNRARRRKKFFAYWKEEIPKIMYESRMRLLFAFLLFTISMSIGIISSIHDPGFPRQILGDAYVNMTEENIDNGDPMNVYKDADSTNMFFGITWNNLRVAFWCFILGIFLGAGTAYIIIFNGIMLGVFQYFFIERDLFAESFLTIWVHGALEICAIVISGAAGFELGKGILLPGTYSRLQSFRISAIRGIKVFTGIIPIIIIAGFNESFLTRYTEVNDWVRGTLIAIEFAFMFFYYVYFPWKKSKTGFAVKERQEELPPALEMQFRFDTIKTGASVFADGFLLFGKYYAAIIKVSALISISFFFVFLFFIQGTDYFNSTSNILQKMLLLLDMKNNVSRFALNTFMIGMAFSFFSYCVIATKEGTTLSFKKYLTHLLRNSIPCFSAAALLVLLCSINGNIRFLLTILAFPYLCLYVAQGTSGKGLKQKFSLIFFRTNIGYLFLVSAAFILLSCVILILSNLGLSQLLLEILEFNLPFDEQVKQTLLRSILAVIITFEAILLFSIFFFNMSFLHYSMLETRTAENLKQRIQQLKSVRPT